MPIFRYKTPSVDQQQIAYRKRKFRRRLFWTLTFLVVVAGGIVFLFNQKSTPEDSAQANTPAAPPAMPTEINPNFIAQVNECFLPTAAVYGYDLRITSGFRSSEEQDNLYNQGRTVDGHIVTEAPAGKSIHNYGYAVDVADRERAFDIDWQKLGRIGTYCSLEQGPDGDLPHFENRQGLTTDQFAQGMRPPDLSLPCPVMKDRYDSGQALTLSDLTLCGAPDFNKITN